MYIPKWRTSSILFRINGTLHLLDKSVWWILMKHGCSPHAVEQTAGCNSKKPLSKNGITIQLSSLQSQELDAPAPDAAEDHEDILLVVLTSGDQQRVICWTVWEVVQNVLRHPEQNYRTICMCHRCLSSNSGPGLQKKEDQARWPSNFQERLLGTQQQSGQERRESIKLWHVITVAFSTQRLNHFLRLPHLSLCSFGQWSFILFASICHYIMLHRFVFQSWSISSSEWNKTVGSESSPLSKRSMCELASEFWVGSSSRLEYGRIWLNTTAWINSINL